jgi:hypothetical protein
VPPISGVGPDQLFFSDAEVPTEVLASLRELRHQKTFIHPLEEIGVVAPYFSPELQEVFRGRLVLHFADNQAANGAAVKGYSRALDLSRIVHSLHMRLSSLGIRLWIDYVRSAGNIADAPSRSDYQWLQQRGAQRVTFVIPPFAAGWQGE